MTKPAFRKAGALSARPLWCKATTRGTGEAAAAAARWAGRGSPGRERPDSKPGRSAMEIVAAKGSRACLTHAHLPRCPARHSQGSGHGGKARPGKSHPPRHALPRSMAKHKATNNVAKIILAQGVQHDGVPASGQYGDGIRRAPCFHNA